MRNRFFCFPGRESHLVKLAIEGIDTKLVKLLYIRVMKNVTISMPEELAHEVEVPAAEKAAETDKYTSAMRRYLSRVRVGLRLAGRKLPTRDELFDRNVPL